MIIFRGLHLIFLVDCIEYVSLADSKIAHVESRSYSKMHLNPKNVLVEFTSIELTEGSLSPPKQMSVKLLKENT